MNANQARPLLAFWALAVAAAVITGIGLRAGTRDVTVSAGAPAPVQTSGASELVLGGILHADRTGLLANPLAPSLWSSLAGGAVGATAGGAVQVAAPSSAPPKARSHATGHAQPVTVPTDTSGVTRALDTASPRPHKDPPGQTKTTTTTTATAKPTDGTHGKGKGSGGEHPGNGRGR